MSIHFIPTQISTLAYFLFPQRRTNGSFSQHQWQATSRNVGHFGTQTKRLGEGNDERNSPMKRANGETLKSQLIERLWKSCQSWLTSAHLKKVGSKIPSFSKGVGCESAFKVHTDWKASWSSSIFWRFQLLIYFERKEWIKIVYVSYVCLTMLYGIFVALHWRKPPPTPQLSFNNLSSVKWPSPIPTKDRPLADSRRTATPLITWNQPAT